MVGLTAADNEVDGFAITAVRPPAGAAPRSVTAGAFDDKGRRIADATRHASARAKRRRPARSWCRSSCATTSPRSRSTARPQAGAVRVLDESAKRRRVGLLSQARGRPGQPLLSPLYYIRRALEPFADLVEPPSPDLAEAIPQLLEQKPAMIVMADIGTIPDSARKPADRMGGERRHAGALRRLAAAARRQRRGAAAGAACGSASARWAARCPGRAAAGRRVPAERPVRRPAAAVRRDGDAAGAGRADAGPRRPHLGELADGTPLVTGDRRGKGMVVLFHVTPQATWSNLPISGTFVEMLRRIVQLSRNQGAAPPGSEAAAVASLAPYRMIAADGALVPPGPDAKPLADRQRRVAGDDREPARPLRHRGRRLRPQSACRRCRASRRSRRPQIIGAGRPMRYAFDESRDLKGPLVAAALALLVLDTPGRASGWAACSRRRRDGRRRRRRDRRGAAGRRCVAAGAPRRTPRRRMPSRATHEAIEAISHDPSRLCASPAMPRVDSISRAGLAGLSRFLDREDRARARRAGRRRHRAGRAGLLPDHLLADRRRTPPMPSEAAIARIDAYMKEGGTVLFDTRDQFATGIDDGCGQPGDRAAARHPRQSRRSAAGAGAGRPCADQVLLHPARVSRPLQRQPALGRGLARRRATPTTARCAPATASRRS